MRVPQFPPPPPPPPPPPTDKHIAEAELQVSQIQDLADEVSKLMQAAAGQGLRFWVKIELDENASEGVVEEINEILTEIDPGLEMD